MGKALHVTFDDFSGGDYGREFPSQGQLNKFRGVNVWPYPNGAIGPRPPFRRFNPTNPLPAQAVVFADQPPAADPVALLGNGKAYNLRSGLGSVATTPIAAKNYGSYVMSTQYFVALAASGAGNGIFIQTGVAPPVITTVPTMPPGAWIKRFGPHFVIGDPDISQIKWSIPNAADWSVAANFAIIPPILLDMENQKNTLLLAVAAGNQALPEIWAITGVLNVNAILRRVDQGPRANLRASGFPTAPGLPFQGINNDVVYWIGDRRIMSFNGAEVRSGPAPIVRILSSVTDYIVGPNNAPVVWNIVPLMDQDEFVALTSVPNTNTDDVRQRRSAIAWHHGNGSWTYHDPQINFRGDTSRNGLLGDAEFALSYNRKSNLHGYIKGGVDVADGMSQIDLEILTGGSGNATTEAPKQYDIALFDSFPKSDADGDSGASVTAEFRTAEVWADDGQETYVRRIHVDYSFPHVPGANLTADTTFTIAVEALQLYNDTRVRTSTAQVFVPPPGTIGSAPTGAGASADAGYDWDAYATTANTEIIRGHAVFAVGDQGTGNGFRIKITAWKGIMIHRITVLGETNEART